MSILVVSPIRRYDEITSKGPVRSDPDQRKVIEKLDNLWYELREYKPKVFKEQGKSRSVRVPRRFLLKHWTNLV
jgi:predicted ATPase